MRGIAWAVLDQGDEVEGTFADQVLRPVGTNAETPVSLWATQTHMQT
jgi:hypothetical protein